MKPRTITSAALTLAAFLLGGCGQSSSNSNDTAQSSPTTQPTATPAGAPATPTASTTPTVTPPPAASANAANASTTSTAATLASTAPAAQDALTAPVTQFASTAAAQTDKQAASIGSELTARMKSLAQSAAGNQELKTQLGSALKSLSSGQDASALGTLFQQAKQANLTPQQTQMVKDVGNVASAYVVQRNFSSLDGAQGDVATIVNSLRKGSVAPAVPALQSLAQNASLTSQQKDLLGTLADQYAPGLKKASDSLKQGLQGLQGLGK